MTPCPCTETHPARRIVLTGGPGAGKTAVLELVRHALCEHVRIIPEAAGVVFGGGFPRELDLEARRAAQRAIFYVQRELEAAAQATNPAIVLCDRGTVDGVAYWPGPDDLWSEVGTTLDEQLARYAAVLHLRTPDEAGYDHSNPLRVETALEARAIDERIAAAWQRHPRRFEIPSTPDFVGKAARAVELLRAELPRCCFQHAVSIAAKR
jgi:predicted ATPase